MFLSLLWLLWNSPNLLLNYSVHVKPEIEREQLQYETFSLLFEGQLFFAPLKNPKRALDIGTGSGLWAIEMGVYFLCIYLLTIQSNSMY